MKNSINILVSILTILCIFIAPGYSSAAEVVNTKAKTEIQLTEEQSKELKKHMSSLNISEATQEKLIQKIKEGKQLDSQNQELINKVPIEKLTPTEKEPVKEYIFPDGSKIKNSLEKIPSKKITTNLGTSCGSGYCNYYSYVVRHETVYVVALFLADFSISYGKSYVDSISSVYDEQASVFIGTLESVDLNLVRDTENTYTGQKALATLTVKYKIPFNAGSSTSYLRLYVGQDTYSVVPSNF